MESFKVKENVIRSGLYNSKQLFIATIVGGPEIAGIIIAFNLWARKKKLIAIIPIFSGLLLEFVLIIPVLFISHFFKSFTLRHIIAFASFFLLQAVCAFLIRSVLKKKISIRSFIFPEIDEEIYHHRKLYPVVIISIVYLLTIFTFNYYLLIVLGFFLFTHFYGYILIYKTFGNYKFTGLILSAIVFLCCLIPFVDSTGQILGAYTKKVFMAYTYLNLITGFYVIFVFYLFLFITGLNILLLINRLIGIIQRRIFTNKTFILAAIIIPIGTGAILLAVGSYINNNPVIRRYSITIPQKSSSLNSLKVISVSDLHLKEITSANFLRKLVRAISISNPDIIVLPGDVVETYRIPDKEKLEEFIEILKDIKPQYGIFAVKGNHDYPGPVKNRTDFYDRLGIIMLEDTLIESGNRFCLIGLNYRGNNEKRPIDSLLRFRTSDLPVLLLDHAPYCFEEAVRNKIDVQFSGHTHYGQIWPLNYVTEALYKIAWGYKKIGCTNIFVSCGAQDAYLPGRQDLSVPVRIGSVSEIMEINIKLR